MSPQKLTADKTAKNLQYILLVLSTMTGKPNYRTVAQRDSLASAKSAQKKFKKVIEECGYALSKDAIVRKAGPPRTATATSAPTPPATPKKGSATKRKQGNGTPASRKKRKISEVDSDESEEDDTWEDEVYSDESEEEDTWVNSEHSDDED